ncbi:MAG: hypothetical protein P1U65_15605 [Minwuia sp.]|nr:hypothetical protein [Minwuia sp.]
MTAALPTAEQTITCLPRAASAGRVSARLAAVLRGSLMVGGLLVLAHAGVAQAQTADHGIDRVTSKAGGTLRLVAPSDSEMAKLSGIDDRDAPALIDLLSLTPRAGGSGVTGLNLSIETSEAGAGGQRVGIDFSDRALGVDYSVFGSVGDTPDRNGVSSLTTAAAISRPGLSVAAVDPTYDPERGSAWQVGGRIGFDGFSIGAGLAQGDDQRLRRSLTDYRLGLRYAGSNWQVGMSYVRSLSEGAATTQPDVADALEIGGAWQLNGSIGLVGGIQLWDQGTATSLDSETSRDALLFLGTRIQF